MNKQKFIRAIYSQIENSDSSSVWVDGEDILTDAKTLHNAMVDTFDILDLTERFEVSSETKNGTTYYCIAFDLTYS